jgi:N-acetylneuraminic acid mutarotase
MKKTFLFRGILSALILLANLACQKAANEPDPPDPVVTQWLRVAEYGGGAVRGSAAFAIGADATIVSGQAANQMIAWVYRYNAAGNTWTRKTDFPGTPRLDASGFAIGARGYVCLGGDNGSIGLLKDVWEYDPQNDAWTQKADFPGSARLLATALVIGQKAYIVGGGRSGVHLKDVWEFDPQADTWTRKKDFPGWGVNSAAGFVIGDRGYMGTGAIDGAVWTTTCDFWEYDPAGDSWTKRADFPGVTRGYAQGFAIGSKGYIGLGVQYVQPMIVPVDLWEYDPQSNAWTRQPDLPASGRGMAVSFVIDSRGYVGLGNGAGSSDNRDVWKFTPR